MCGKGEFLTTLNRLEKETNLSKQSIRTAINKLEINKTIFCVRKHRYHLIKLLNYDKFQQNDSTKNDINKDTKDDKDDKDDKMKAYYNWLRPTTNK